jgi:ABC-type multidrug transport system ATPase subunit
VGPTLEWQDVSFHVGDKPILSNVSGAIAGGSVCAILGPSGAGKSSLLNVLAGRSASRGPVKVSAYMSVDGKAVNPVTFRRNVAYVMQVRNFKLTRLRATWKFQYVRTTTKSEIDLCHSCRIFSINGIHRCSQFYLLPFYT